jgi:hypothetical protein
VVIQAKVWPLKQVGREEEHKPVCHFLSSRQALQVHGIYYWLVNEWDFTHKVSHQAIYAKRTNADARVRQRSGLEHTGTTSLYFEIFKVILSTYWDSEDIEG